MNPHEQPRRRPGRPRPRETIERDRLVLNLVARADEGCTSREIADAIGIDRRRAHLSLRRLRSLGLVERSGRRRGRAPLWTAPVRFGPEG